MKKYRIRRFTDSNGKREIKKGIKKIKDEKRDIIGDERGIFHFQFSIFLFGESSNFPIFKSLNYLLLNFPFSICFNIHL